MKRHMTQGRWHGRHERGRGQCSHDTLSVTAQALTDADIDTMAAWHAAVRLSVQLP